MLARASSDAGTRLRRSKSTSTVHRPPPSILEPLDPDTARKQALAAATAAFARARVHDVEEQRAKQSSEVTRSKSNASRKSHTSQGQGSHFPPRESSFRSLQPQKTEQDIDTQQPYRASTMNTEKFPPFHPMPSIVRPIAAPRALSTQPSIAFSDNSRPNTQPKTGRQSGASSITSQQIRKARSMYYASNVQTGSPIARPPTKYLTTPPSPSMSPTLEVTATLSVARTLGPSPLAEPRIPVTVAPDESVDKARDKYLQSFQQRSVKHKPSLFLAPFIKRQDRGKDKSKRMSSGYTSASASSQRTPDESAINVTMDDFIPPPDKKDKRSFSGSLKSKIKRVFRRTSKTSPPNLPVQQIEASRDYFGTAHSELQRAGDGYGIPSPERDILQRVRSRNPSLEASRPMFLRSGSRTSSNGSARSDCSNRSLHSEMHATNTSVSRVTSWGTSTTDTVDQRAIKRLTVIHESKDSIGSEVDRVISMSTKRKSLPPGALAAFRDPMPMESLMEESSTPVDPKRVFSALMKEIGSSKSTEFTSNPADRTPGAESDVFESSKTKILHSGGRELQSSASKEFRPSMGNDQRPPSRRPPSAAAQSTQSKTSSMRTLARAIRSTIRTVTPGEQQSSPSAKQPASVCGGVRIPNDDAETSSYIATPQSDETCVSDNTEFVHQDGSLDVFSPSPMQIEKGVEKAKGRWKTPLDDVEKLQFPRETDRTYKVANFTQEAVTYETSRKSIDQVGTFRTDLPALPKAPVSPLPRPVMSPLSPSIYSRNTDGMSILPNDSVMSFEGHNELERQHNGGSAVILTSQSVRSYVLGTPSPCRPGSSRSSRDWKAWLSHEVSSIESTSQEDLKIHESYMTPSGKHRIDVSRTSHTEQDDTTVILHTSCDTTAPRAEEDVTIRHDFVRTAGAHKANIGSEEEQDLTIGTSSVLKESQQQTDTCKEVSPGHTPPTGHAQAHMVTSTGLTPRLPRQHMSLKPSYASPPDDVTLNDFSEAAKATPSPSIPEVHVPPTNQTSQRVPQMALRRSEPQHNSKENVTPPSIGANKGTKRPNISPLGLASRPKSLQPICPAERNRSTTSVGQYTTNIPEIKHSKHDSSPAASPPRPRIRATIRPISPEKLSRRPKSAFDLRGVKTSLPRPTSDLRRPALQFRSSASSLALNKEPSPGAEARVIDGILKNCERSGSITPGQRMADLFIRERKSTGVLESEKYRGGLRLAREDTPAFL